MATENYYKDVKHVICLSTNIGQGCQICQETSIFDDIEKSINHYISTHGYKILHVGQESKESGSGNPISDTVAILGK